MTITKQAMQRHIDDCMARGAKCERISDQAYQRCDLPGGDAWASRALAHYTNAEEMSHEIERLSLERSLLRPPLIG